MKVEFKGKEATIEKRDLYCKAGAYEHKYRKGWVLVVDGDVVLGGKVYPRNICDGAAAHEYPAFSTRKDLVERVRELNERWATKG